MMLRSQTRLRTKFSLSAVVLLSSVTGCEGATRTPQKMDPALNPANMGTGGQVSTNPPAMSSGGPVVPPPASVCATAAPQPGPSPLRRLTHTEYDNTVGQLLATTTTPARAFPKEQISVGGIFDNGATVRTVDQIQAEQYAKAARSLAQLAGTNLSGTLGCDPVAAGEDACAAGFIESFGLRTYRRPVGASEKDRLTTFYQASKTEFGFPTAVEMLVQAMLQTAQFLYRMETAETAGPPLGATPAVVQAGPFELASRLSYLLWQSMPDGALFAAAQSGELTTPAQVSAQARRLLLDPKARSAVVNFHSQLFEFEVMDHLAKDPTLFPNFSSNFGPLLREGAEAFVASTIFDGAGNLGALLTSSQGFVNDALAPLYGTAAPGSAALTAVTLPANERAGLLTQAGWLAVHAGSTQGSPVTRGYFVRANLFCAPPPPPPPGLNIMVPPFDPASTTRERFATHRTDPACSACHQLMDPVGLGFENYDATGSFRSQEANRPVDAAGELTGTDVDGPFNGAVELAQKLAASPSVRDCAVNHWFHFSFGRNETQEDGCTLRQLRDGFAASNGDVRELLVTLTQTNTFLYRNAAQ